MDSKINFKDLLKIAVTELQNLTTVSNPDFRLEQAEFDKEKKEWEIVVSYLVDNPVKLLGTSSLAGLNTQRVFKRLKINSQKEVMGFYIFEN
ncbi:hypothetical protein EF405_11945 [Cyclobacteriaceae bacterium YHN15]|jgi:hypothetical protein|nr:hypothetical protein EF405_11945 [Cyclobacteriaceae bacterium YHN15]